MNHPDWQLLAEKAALYLYPRRCPFCGAVLGRDAVQGTVCPACFEAARQTPCASAAPPAGDRTCFLRPEQRRRRLLLQRRGPPCDFGLQARRGTVACPGVGRPHGRTDLGRHAVPHTGPPPGSSGSGGNAPLPLHCAGPAAGAAVRAPPVCRFCWPGGWAY